MNEKQILVFDTVIFDSLFCVNYSDVTFGEYEQIIDYNLEGNIELTEENVRKMFLGNKEKVEIISYENGTIVDSILTDEYLKERAFYLKHIVSSNTKWTAIIIEEIDYGGAYKQSDKYLVIIDKKQNLISKYRIAFYRQFGTYTCDSEMQHKDEGKNIITDRLKSVFSLKEKEIDSYERCPWFTGAEGCIDKDLTIGVDAGQFYSSNAIINKDGNIVKVK